MYRPGTRWYLALTTVLLIGSRADAQALSFLSGEPAHTVPETLGASSGSSVSPMFFSVLSWRFGQLSPYNLSSVTGSATAQQTLPSPSLTANNLLAGSTLGMQGDFTSGSPILSAAPSNSSIVSAATSSSAEAMFRRTFVPRFVFFSSLEPTVSADPIPSTSTYEGGINLSRFQFIPNDVTPLATIPEPSIWLMYGGVLAIASYVYSRRRTKTVTEPQLAGTVTDAVQNTVV